MWRGVVMDYSGRICLECIHLYYWTGCPGYSELTPGYDAEIRCTKQYWEVDWTRDEKQDLRGKLRMAVTCKDYEPDPELVEELK
jgi:hypothetical protein